MIACLFNPVGCVSDWFTSLPLLWLMGGSFVVGLVLGAIFGKWAVGGFLVLVGLLLFWRRPEPYPTDLPEPDARPSWGKPKVAVKRTTTKPTPPPKPPTSLSTP